MLRHYAQARSPRCDGAGALELRFSWPCPRKSARLTRGVSSHGESDVLSGGQPLWKHSLREHRGSRRSHLTPARMTKGLTKGFFHHSGTGHASQNFEHFRSSHLGTLLWEFTPRTACSWQTKTIWIRTLRIEHWGGSW